MTLVMTDKEYLIQELNKLTLKELRGIIKEKHLYVYGNIMKEKDRGTVIDYIVAEADRQMHHATII